jgi:hypothetical protein
MPSLPIRLLIAAALATTVSCGDNHAGSDAASDATLHIDVESIDLGSVTFGDTSPAATFTISNTGTLASGSITATLQGDLGSFSVDRNDCATLAPAATCQVAVVFAPTSAGAKATTLHVSANPGGAVDASLTGRGAALGALSIAASVNMLGSVVVGKLGTTTATFTVTNTGDTTTGAITLQPTGSDPSEFATSEDTCAGHTLAAADSCSFVATFSPMSAGAKSALFEVSANPGSSVSGAVNGVGLAPARLVALAVERNLGSVIVTSDLLRGNLRLPSSGVSIIVTNVGDVATDPLVASVSGSDAPSFSLTGCVGEVIAPKESCTLGVHLTPLHVGAQSAQLTIAGAPGASIATLLIGFGIAADQLVIDQSTASY